jgi:hypothetical protein
MIRASYADSSAEFLAVALADIASAIRSNTDAGGVVYDLQITFAWERPDRSMPIVKTAVGAQSVVVADLGNELEILL